MIFSFKCLLFIPNYFKVMIFSFKCLLFIPNYFKVYLFIFFQIIGVEASPLPIVECLTYRGCLMHDDDHYVQNFTWVQKRKMFLAFIYYHFHLLLALARQKICIDPECKHDAFRYALPSLHKIKYMLYNNRYGNFMLNWNILDFDGLNRYIHTEKIDVKEQEHV